MSVRMLNYGAGCHTVRSAVVLYVCVNMYIMCMCVCTVYNYNSLCGSVGKDVKREGRLD